MGGGRAKVHPSFTNAGHASSLKSKERKGKEDTGSGPRLPPAVWTSTPPPRARRPQAWTLGRRPRPISDHILRDKRFLENPTQADSVVAKPCGHAVATGVGQNPFLESPAWSPRPRSRARPRPALGSRSLPSGFRGNGVRGPRRSGRSRKRAEGGGSPLNDPASVNRWEPAAKSGRGPVLPTHPSWEPGWQRHGLAKSRLNSWRSGTRRLPRMVVTVLISKAATAIRHDRAGSRASPASPRAARGGLTGPRRFRRRWDQTKQRDAHPGGRPAAPPSGPGVPGQSLILAGLWTACGSATPERSFPWSRGPRAWDWSRQLRG